MYISSQLNPTYPAYVGTIIDIVYKKILSVRCVCRVSPSATLSQTQWRAEWTECGDRRVGEKISERSGKIFYASLLSLHPTYLGPMRFVVSGSSQGWAQAPFRAKTVVPVGSEPGRPFT